LELIQTADTFARPAATPRIAAVQFLQNLNPDLDAVYRLTHEIPRTFDPAVADCVATDSAKYAPFNAQSTLFYEDAFFGPILPITVNGGVADIWRSFVVERILRAESSCAAFCPAIVEHRRIARLSRRKFLPQQGKPLEALHDVYIGLVEHGILEELDRASLGLGPMILECARRDSESDRDPPTEARRVSEATVKQS
jgi:hypothetical protein